MNVKSAIPILSSKNFLERALCELRELKNEVLELAADHDIYWKVQYEVIQRNARLLAAHSPFFDMMNDAYAHSAAMRVRRIVDRDDRTISLRKLLNELVNYPDLLNQQVTALELTNDIQALDQATSKVKAYVDQFIAHHDRTPTADTPFNRELSHSIDTVIRTFKKYYGILAGVDLDVVIDYSDPLAIFRFAWIEAEKGATKY